MLVVIVGWVRSWKNLSLKIETRTAWAVFKYCGTKTVTLRMRKKIWIDWFKIYIKRNKQNKG